jgi:hypothetical protein
MYPGRAVAYGLSGYLAADAREGRRGANLAIVEAETRIDVAD